MNQNKKSFFKIKVRINFFLFFLILVFVLGYFWGNQKRFIIGEKNTDLSLMYKTWDILEKDFFDTHKESREGKKITKEDNLWGIISGLVSSYQDPYTVFLPPSDSKELNEDISGEFGGIGVEIENRDGFLTVISPLQGTPANDAGLLPKDIIVKIDEKDSTNISSHKAVGLIRGEPGTKVKLGIARRGEPKVIDVEIERAIIEIPIIKTYKKDEVFIIKLFSFSENSPKLFFSALKEFSKTGYDKLIIDLRGNPGGHLFASVYIAGFFLPEGKTVIVQEFLNKKEILKSGQYHSNSGTTDIFSERIKIGVLVNGGSASASEILAGSLRDHDRAIIMGTTTYGKGTVQELKKIGNGASLKYTTAKFVLPRGKWISQKGLSPDIEIKISPEEIEIAKEGGSFSKSIDPQLEKAIVQIKKFKKSSDILKIIQDKRVERKKEVQKERKEKLKKILNKGD